ncbi:MAG TPA: SGNH/GDSL hydrolase family protein [Candidatus Angelobacter sp.]|jgi:lysophospholipase L1-like esterase|nr:SGNH/GDSL hydrolase family protein [Candidatus Angelobacter sp.]
MRSRASLLPHLLAVLGLGAVLAGCGSGPAAPPSTVAPSATASASASALPRALGGLIPVAGQAPVGDQPWYLAAGDSVTFGFTVDPSRFGVNSSWALQLQPLLAASGRTWSLYDTACPSERTTTYYTLCPGRSQVPFLATTSQHDAAIAAAGLHRASLRAVFVDLGSNDLLDGLRHGATVAAMSAALTSALTRMVDEFHAAAPGVPVILCNFYNPLANLEPATRAQLLTVNAAVAAVATATGARLADFFSAIDTSTAVPDPHLCDYVDCAHGDVHPTVAGQARLARAALAALDAR